MCGREAEISESTLERTRCSPGSDFVSSAANTPNKLNHDVLTGSVHTNWLRAYITPSAAASTAIRGPKLVMHQHRAFSGFRAAGERCRGLDGALSPDKVAPELARLYRPASARCSENCTAASGS